MIHEEKSSVNIIMVLLRILGFLLFCAVFYVIMTKNMSDIKGIYRSQKTARTDFLG